jgi:hypothetical protein
MDRSAITDCSGSEEFLTIGFIGGCTGLPFALGRKTADEEGEDRVVKYRSAHIDGVESELVVRSGHLAQGNPKTIEEVRRILQLHASAK